MSTDPNSPNLPRKDSFAWYEKLIARSCLGGAIVVGAVSIYQSSLTFAVGYLLLAAVGGLLVVYDFLCPYCPYPFSHSDCLFYPYQLLAWVTEIRGGRIHWVRNLGTVAAFGAIFAVPQYWLWGQWSLFAVFWGCTLPLVLLFPLHLCRRCRHERCPMHQALSG